LRVAVELRGTLQVALKLTGTLDLASAPLLQACFENQLHTGRRYGRIDLGGVNFVDPAGFAPVLAAHHAFAAAHGMLVLTQLSPGVARLIPLLGLESELLVCPEQLDLPGHLPGLAAH
jgi:anti-anti-sigma factor